MQLATLIASSVFLIHGMFAVALGVVTAQIHTGMARFQDVPWFFWEYGRLLVLQPACMLKPCTATDRLESFYTLPDHNRRYHLNGNHCPATGKVSAYDYVRSTAPAADGSGGTIKIDQSHNGTYGRWQSHLSFIKHWLLIGGWCADRRHPCARTIRA